MIQWLGGTIVNYLARFDDSMTRGGSISMRHSLTAMAANDIHEGGIVQSGPLSLQHTAIHNNYHIRNHRYPNTPGWHFKENSNPLTWMWLSSYFEKRPKVVSCSFSNFFLAEKGEAPGESTLTKVLPVWKSFDWNSSSQFYLICMGSISLSLSFNWNSSYSILFEMRAGSPNSRAADVRRVDWTLNMWFSYLDSLIKWSNTYIAEGVNPILA